MIVNLSNLKKQTGAALITALVFMGILTMLGITAMRSNSLDVRIHNAMKDRANAFQCAEAALRQGELFIANQNTKPEDFNTGVPNKDQGQVWMAGINDLDDLVNEATDWWDDNAWSEVVLSDPDSRVGCADPANYIVQSLGGVGGGGSGDLSFKAKAESQISGYRITSRSEGTSENAAVILQSTFIRQFH